MKIRTLAAQLFHRDRQISMKIIVAFRNFAIARDDSYASLFPCSMSTRTLYTDHPNTMYDVRLKLAGFSLPCPPGLIPCRSTRVLC